MLVFLMSAMQKHADAQKLLMKHEYQAQCSCSCSFGSVVEHCVSNAKGHGFNSQGTHILIIYIYIYSLNTMQVAFVC